MRRHAPTDWHTLREDGTWWSRKRLSTQSSWSCRENLTCQHIHYVLGPSLCGKEIFPCCIEPKDMEGRTNARPIYTYIMSHMIVISEWPRGRAKAVVRELEMPLKTILMASGAPLRYIFSWRRISKVQKGNMDAANPFKGKRGKQVSKESDSQPHNFLTHIFQDGCIMRWLTTFDTNWYQLDDAAWLIRRKWCRWRQQEVSSRRSSRMSRNQEVRHGVNHSSSNPIHSSNPKRCFHIGI